MKTVYCIIFLISLSRNFNFAAENQPPVLWVDGNASPVVINENKVFWHWATDMTMALVVTRKSDQTEVELFLKNESILKIPDASKCADKDTEKFTIRNFTPFPPLISGTINERYLLLIDKNRPLVFFVAFDKKSGEQLDGISDKLKTEIFLCAKQMGWVK